MILSLDHLTCAHFNLVLYISLCRLSSLPAEIGKLANLQSLSLSFNHLGSLPAEIGKLTNLQSLNLRNNRLSSLPKEIGKLANLQSLNLQDNQLDSLPPEIRKYSDDPRQAAAEVPRYYRQILEQETGRLYRPLA